MRYGLADATAATATFAYGVLTEVRAVTTAVGGRPPLDLKWRPELGAGRPGVLEVTDAATGGRLVNTNATFQSPSTTLDFSRATTGRAYNIRVNVKRPQPGGFGTSVTQMLGNITVKPGDTRGQIVDAIHDLLTAARVENRVTEDGNLVVYDQPGAPLAGLELYLYTGPAINVDPATGPNLPVDNTLVGPSAVKGVIPIRLNGDWLRLPGPAGNP